ncbi:MAG TPA: hypothetical protein VGE74_07925 [Gemmata sp.]
MQGTSQKLTRPVRDLLKIGMPVQPDLDGEHTELGKSLVDQFATDASDSQLLTFRVADEEHGLEIHSVHENQGNT